MKIYFHVEPEEVITNFRVAEAVVNLCDEAYKLNAETVARMILLQVDANTQETLKNKEATE